MERGFRREKLTEFKLFLRHGNIVTELSRIPDDKLENTDQSGLFDLLRRLTLSSLWK